MHKRLKILINNIKEVFSFELLDKFSKKTKFLEEEVKLQLKYSLYSNFEEKQRAQISDLVQIAFTE
jgi:hypothetical protein